MPRAIALIVLCPALLLAACAGASGTPAGEAGRVLPGPEAGADASAAGGITGPAGGLSGTPPEAAAPESLPAALEELAELERSGTFVPGLGLAESNLREQAGDYAGAVLAVFKELSWAYALGLGGTAGGNSGGAGNGGVTREAIREGLTRLLEPETRQRFSETGRRQTEAAVAAILAFFDGRWKEAEEQLRALYRGEDDSFSRWMLLVCALETAGETGDREARSAYGAIRARYAAFPEYWFRAARAFRGGAGYADGAGYAGGAIAADYAERCINLAPSGPYADECRIILAESMGLGSADAPAVKTRLEIEAAVSGAVNQGDPGLLAELLPLMALPDNPSTLYASGALRALAQEGPFRAWFLREAERSQGRRAERLLYISRG
ncbi:MAG: hypothetical protein LBC31_07555 [Treponema sp.]|nr:hypothetical protein [Treponema sp.]